MFHRPHRIHITCILPLICPKSSQSSIRLPKSLLTDTPYIYAQENHQEKVEDVVIFDLHDPTTPIPAQLLILLQIRHTGSNKRLGGNKVLEFDGIPSLDG